MKLGDQNHEEESGISIKKQRVNDKDIIPIYSLSVKHTDDDVDQLHEQQQQQQQQQQQLDDDEQQKKKKQDVEEVVFRDISSTISCDMDAEMENSSFTIFNPSNGEYLHSCSSQSLNSSYAIFDLFAQALREPETSYTGFWSFNPVEIYLPLVQDPPSAFAKSISDNNLILRNVTFEIMHDYQGIFEDQNILQFPGSENQNEGCTNLVPYTHKYMMLFIINHVSGTDIEMGTPVIYYYSSPEALIRDAVYKFNVNMSGVDVKTFFENNNECENSIDLVLTNELCCDINYSHNLSVGAYHYLSIKKICYV